MKKNKKDIDNKYSKLEGATSEEIASELSMEQLLHQKSILENINKYASLLSSIPFSDDFFKIASKTLKEIIGATAVGLSIYDETSKEIVVRYVASSNKDISILENIFGRKASGMRLKVSDEFYQKMLDEPVLLSNSIDELTFGNFPKTLGKVLETVAGIDRVIGYSLRHEGKIIGSIGIVGNSRKVNYTPQEMTGFVEITSIALQRWLKERERLEEEQRYKLITENSSDAIWILGLDLKFQYISPVVAKIRGFSPEEAMNHSLGDILPEKYKDAVMAKLQEELAKESSPIVDPNRSVVMELEEYHKEGHKVWVETKVKFLRDEKLKATGLLGISRDISERKKQEAQLNMLSSALSNSINGYDIVSEDGKFIYVNDAYVKMWGYDSAEEIIGTSPAGHCLNPEMPIEIIKTLKEKGYGRFEFLAKRKDGSTFVALMDTYIYRDDFGNVFYSGSSIDITERTIIENKLRESEEHLRITLNSIGDGVITTDTDGIITRMNPKAEELTGWNIQEAAGKALIDVFKIVSAGSREVLQNPAELVIKSNASVELKNSTILISKDGNERQISDSAAPIKDSQGVIRGVVIVFSDVSKEYQYKESLKAGQQKLQEAEIKAGFGYWEFFIDSKKANASAGTRSIFGFDDEELFIDDFLSQMSPQYKNLFVKILENIFVELPEEIQVKIKNKKDNSTRILSTNLEVSEDKTFLYGLVQDITEAKISAEALEFSEARYRQIVEKLSLGLVIQQNNKIVFANKAAFAMIGAATSDDLIGKNLSSFIVEEDRDEVIQMLMTIERSNLSDLATSDKNLEERIMKLDGSIIFIEASAVAIDHNNKPALMIWINDITKRKEAEESVRKSEEKFRSLAETTQDIIIRFDDELNIKYINSSGLIFFQINENECLGKSSAALPLFDESNLSLWEEFIKKVFDDGKTQRFEIVFEAEGTLNILDWYFAPEFDSSRKVRSVMGISRDITEMKLIQTELEQAIKKAENSDKLKSAFLANMSHEIRTPMNGIIGFSNLLSQSELPFEERKEYADVLNKSANRLMDLMNNIIDISKIETQQMDLAMSEFDLNSLLFDIFEDFSKSAKEKNLDMTLSYGLPHGESIIFSDEMKLARILKALISNSIKFTAKGNIGFGYKVIDKELHFFVKDTGIGIAEHFLTSVFDRFSQEDNSFNRNFEGSGLGLSIAKGMVELLGGSIDVESRKNEGSIFFFKIPYISKAQNNSFDDKLSPKKKVIIAEDDKISFILLNNLLNKNFNFDVYHATNGEEAVNLVNSVPDILLVLMDIKMPVMDGKTATNLIKMNHPNLPIIAITALAMLGDKESILEAGCDDYVTKPFDPKDVINVLNKYL